jgi:hypothetical protein
LLRRPRISVSVNRVAAVLISVSIAMFIAVSISASNSISIALSPWWGRGEKIIAAWWTVKRWRCLHASSENDERCTAPARHA